MRKNQHGFSPIEILLLLVIVGLVVFIGFYVINSNHKTDQQLANSSKSSSTSSNQKTASNPTKFVFKELGVQITLPTELKGLTYSKNTDAAGESYGLSTPKFKQLAATCGEDAPTGFADLYAETGQFTSPGDEGSNGLLKQFSSRYFAYGDSLYGNPCDASIYSQLVDMQTSLVTSLTSAFATATEVQ